MAENFRTQILNSKGESAALQTPVRKMGSCTFIYLRHNDIYVLALTRNNANVMLTLKFITSVRRRNGRRRCMWRLHGGACAHPRRNWGEDGGGSAHTHSQEAAL